MPNGSVFTEMQKMTLKKGDTISAKQARRLTLLGLIALHETISSIQKDAAEQDAMIKKLESTSIGLWIAKNPRRFGVLLFVYIALVGSVDIKALVLEIIKMFG